MMAFKPEQFATLYKRSVHGGEIIAFGKTKVVFEEQLRRVLEVSDDFVRVHPAALQFPMISEAEIVELADDIEKNGPQQGLTFWTSQPVPIFESGPDELFLLDGRNRLKAMNLIYL